MRRYATAVMLAAASAGLLAASTSMAQAKPAADVVTTPGGDTVKAPAGWRRETARNWVRFTAPEGDLHVTIVDVGASKDAKAAAQLAWLTDAPGSGRGIAVVTPRPGRQGWDQRASVDYETSAAEHLEIDVLALRHGDAWTVAVVNGSKSTAEKRYAGVAQILQSLHPPGYVAETFAGKVAHRLDATRVEALRAFIRTAAAELGVPGVSLALIDHGEVVFEGGVGVKRLGSPEPVDARTLFMIASNTKGMTTLLLAGLADEGRITWNEPVTRAYPAFRLGDAATTSAVRMRDLVCACTGLPRKDLEWIFDTAPSAPAADTFRQLALTTPTSAFGQVFQYNNQMAAAAGYIAGHLLYPKMELGAAYDRAMETQIFRPLGMNDTTFSFPQALAGDHASPHDQTIDGKTTVSEIGLDEIISPFRPAGGAWSSAHDMIKYVGLELADGRLPDGRRFVSPENLLIRRARGVSTGENQWYGMGLWEEVVSGVSIIHHGGNMPGFQSDIFIIPGANVGAVVLTNATAGSQLLRPFRRRRLELLYDGRPEAAEDVVSSARADADETAAERKRLTVPPDPAVVSRLADRYSNPELGSLEVNRQGGQIRFAFLTGSSAVATRRTDDGSTSLVTIDPGINGYQFVVGRDGNRPTLTTRDGQHVYVFTAK